jgi:hypothetical protein
MIFVRVASFGYSLMYRNDWTVTIPGIETNQSQVMLATRTTLPERLNAAQGGEFISRAHK